MKNNEVASLFKTIADSFLALSEIYSSTSDEPKKMEEAPKKHSTPKEEPVSVAPEDKTYSKEDVRALLSQKAKIEDGKYKSVVKGLVAKYSSDGTLTNVPADKYSELMAELEVIGNA